MTEEAVPVSPTAKASNSWSIGTYVRLKPPIGLKKKNLIGVARRDAIVNENERRSIIEIEIPDDADPGLLHSNESGKIQFEYDHIFDANIDQEEVFNVTARSKILGALEGINCTIFAYGQTGSGKTYTIFGGDTYDERGLIPRTVNMIFDEIAKRSDQSQTFRFEMSFTEVYKEAVYDLLDPSKRGTSIEQWTPVQIMESETGLVLRNINVFEVNSEEDALKLFFLGNSNRMTVATQMNSVSSRSHAVFTILIKSESIRNGKKVYTSGKINLVDLAGSERMYKTLNTRGALTEAKSINLSLHYLEQVVVNLREQAQNQHQQHIPYRNSVLTNMLRDSLGGNCRSCFILTLSLDKTHFSESISTCRFGQRCGEIKVQVHANSEVGLTDQIKELASKVKSLEKQLAVLDEAKAKLAETLEQEREEVKKATIPRSLTTEEKAECKACVQSLFNSAKEIASLKLDESRSEAEVLAATNNILQTSQEELFKVVQAMNKNILVELCIALGGLVQSMYIEREKAKVEEANRAARKAASKGDKAKPRPGEDAGSGEENKKKSNESIVALSSNGNQTGMLGAQGSSSTTRPSSPHSPVPLSATTGGNVVAATSLSQTSIGSAAAAGHISLAQTTPVNTPPKLASNANQLFANNAIIQQLPPASSPTAVVALNNGVVLGQNSSSNNNSSSSGGRRDLTAEQRQMIIAGCQFTKVSRGLFSARQSRWVHVSDDLLNLIWKPTKADANGKLPTVNPLKLFTSVDLDPSDKEGCGLILRGSSNTVHLVTVSESSKEANIALATRWADALRICIEIAQT